MLSSEQLMNFANSEVSFIEDNLLDVNDWKEHSDLHDLIGYDGSPSSSSLDSDQTSSGCYSPTSLNGDDIDLWLQDDFIPSQQTAQLCNIVVKDEPPSPPSLTSTNEINNTFLSDLSTTNSPIISINNLSEIPTAVIPIVPKIPISRISNQKPSLSVQYTSLSTIPINNKPITATEVNPRFPQHNNLPMKTEQLNTAILPREKYSIPPKIVKLENGQFYIARSVLKPPTSKQANTQVGQKRQMPTTASITQDFTDLKNRKRQQRMMKNRESACLSRQRKKEHLTTLEIKVTEITSINEKLMEENKQLRERINMLESENIQLKGRIPIVNGLDNTSKKSTTILAAIILFLLFNPFKFSVTQSQPKRLLLKEKMYVQSYHRGRHLLQYDHSNVNYNTAFVDPYKINSLKDLLQHSFPNKNLKINRQNARGKQFSKTKKVQRDKNTILDNSPYQDTDCEEPFNKTDVSRINKALEELVKEFGKENTNTKSTKKKTLKSKKFHHPRPFPHNCNETEEKQSKPLISPYVRPKHKKINEKMAFMRNRSQELFNEMKRSIQQKPDTYYVVSMKDFLVLPPANYSLEHRPKFSFMLPAFVHTGQNTSYKDPNNLSMLQIDCNVIDTKLVRFEKKAFIEFFLKFKDISRKSIGRNSLLNSF